MIRIGLFVMRWVSQERSFVMRWLSRKGLQYTKKFLSRDCTTLNSSPYMVAVGWGKCMGWCRSCAKSELLVQKSLSMVLWGITDWLTLLVGVGTKRYGGVRTIVMEALLKSLRVEEPSSFFVWPVWPGQPCAIRRVLFPWGIGMKVPLCNFFQGFSQHNNWRFS